MSSAALSPTSPGDATSHHQAVLNDFVDLGHELARLVVEQAKAGILPAAAATTAFDRVGRCVRRCIWLVRKLSETSKAIDRVAVRKRIIREVEDAIQRDADGPQAETLREELLDRLDTPDLEDELGDRPVEDIIQDIVRDLGLAHAPGVHPWSRRTPEDIARLHARAAREIPAAEQTPATPHTQAHPPSPYRARAP